MFKLRPVLAGSVIGWIGFMIGVAGCGKPAPPSEGPTAVAEASPAAVAPTAIGEHRGGGIKLPAPTGPDETLQRPISHLVETAYVPSAPVVPVTSQKTQIDLAGRPVTAYLSQPAGVQPASWLLLVHEWWGLNRDVMNGADRLAREGYRVLVVDLFDGFIPPDRRAAAQTIQNLDLQAALDTLSGAIDWLVAAHPDEPIGVVGYTFGATLALKLAMVDDRPKAFALESPDVTMNLDQAGRIKAPILCQFALLDGITTLSAITDFTRTIGAAGIDISFFSYQMPSGFSLRPEGDEANAVAEQARSQVYEFLKKHLPQASR